MGPCRRASVRAGVRRKSRLPGHRGAGCGAQRAGQGRRRLANSDFNSGLRQCALCVLLDVHHQGPRHRTAEHRQLPGDGEESDPDGDEPGDRAEPGHSRAFSEIQGARRKDAGGADAWCAACDHLCLGAQAAKTSRRIGGGGRAGRRADPGLQGQDRGSDRAGRSGNRDRRLSRYRMAGARRQLWRVHTAT